jgi:aminobenzoyl-glutamate utilization protein B
MTPHLGRSALDALELMNIGANFLREHMAPGTSLQYAIIDGGGVAPNVVPAHAVAHYMIRAPRMAEARDLADRVDDLARGAALMTGTAAAVEARGGAANVVPNLPLLHQMHACMAAFGPLDFSADENRHASALAATLAHTPKAAHAPADIFPDARHAPFHTGLRAFDGALTQNSGSTDVGDVSWIVPTVECATATWAAGTPSHSWQAVSQGKGTGAHRAMIHAAKTMAATGARAARDPALRAAAQADLEARRGDDRYLSLFADSGTTELAVPARKATR